MAVHNAAVTNAGSDALFVLLGLFISLYLLHGWDHSHATGTYRLRHTQRLRLASAPGKPSSDPLQSAAPTACGSGWESELMIIKVNVMTTGRNNEPRSPSSVVSRFSDVSLLSLSRKQDRHRPCQRWLHYARRLGILQLFFSRTRKVDKCPSLRKLPYGLAHSSQRESASAGLIEGDRHLS
jgi:hypothetical protein